MTRTILKSAQPPDVSKQVALIDSVSRIIQAVRQEGDDAIRRFSREFDQVEPLAIRVTEDQKKEAWNRVPKQDIKDIEFSARNIEAFATAQISAITDVEKELLPGVHVGHRRIPIASAGVYVPGGRYPLPSTALMGTIPARVAGVKRIAACAPPVPETGMINDHTLVAMQIGGASEIYCVGGVQAIAALAYGTPTIAPVDIIVGPGNAYVTEAKRQVFGHVAIDFLAGPSEVLILADEFANPVLVAADLLAQAEHDVRSRPFLVTTSQKLVDEVLKEMASQLADLGTAEVARTSWENNGWIYLVSDLEEGVAVTNEVAPEHLEVHVRDWRSIWKKLVNYGSLFLGEESPVAFGDYTSGTNHTLPTMGTARLHGGLWAGMFLKVATHQWMTAEGAKSLAEVTGRFADMEGLLAHAHAARLRAR
jgi:sulfopropanediol 3-dehydrogenase